MVEQDTDNFDVDIKENTDEMFEGIKNVDKETVSITLDKTLVKGLRDYKERNKIKDLSPMLNIILGTWLKKNKDKDKGIKK